MNHLRKSVSLLSFCALCAIGLSFAAFVQVSEGQIGKPAPMPEPVRVDKWGDPLPPGAIGRIGTLRFRHPGGIIAMAFLPDGKGLVTAGNDETLRIWDAPTGKERLCIAMDSKASAIAVAPDGKSIVSGHWGNFRVWNSSTGKLVKTVDDDHLHVNAVTTLALSADGKTLALGDKIVSWTLWDTTTWKPKFQAPADRFNKVNSFAFSRNGESVAITFGDNDVQIWGVETGKLQKHLSVFSRFKPAITACAWSKDGSALVVAGGTAGAAIVDIGKGKTVYEWPKPSSFAAFSPDASICVIGGQKEPFWIVNPKTGDTITALPGCPDGTTMSFSSDGKTIAATRGPAILLWDAVIFKPFFSQDMPTYGINTAIPVRGGQQLLLQSNGQPFSLWKVAANKKVPGFHESDEPNYGVAVFPNGNHLAAGNRHHVFLHSLETGKVLYQLTTSGGDYVVPYGLSFSPNGEILACSSRGCILLWNTKTGKLLSRLQGVVGEYMGKLSFSADSSLAVAATTWGNDIQAWDIATGKMLWTWDQEGQQNSPTICRPKLLARDMFLAVGTEQSLGIYHTPSKQLISGKFNCAGPFDCSRDGRLLASVASDNTVCVWEVATGALLNKSDGFVNANSSICFSSDGRALSIAKNDGTALLWDLWHSKTAVDPSAMKPWEAHWADLLQYDASKAQCGFAAFVKGGDKAVAFLNSRLSPAMSDRRGVVAPAE